MTAVTLPGGRRYRLRGGPGWPATVDPFTCRTAFAAAHVIPDPVAENGLAAPARLDWDATLRFRRHLWQYGFGVAEAMDTAQRGMGLDYPATRELIRRSAAEARAVGGQIVAGVNTDQLPDGPAGLEQVRAAYAEQLADVTGAGAAPVLMCSRQLARVARSADDYLDVYGSLIASADRPVLLHWLGEMFDPALGGYWGSSDPDTATETVLALIREHADRIDGIKISLLDADREVALRRRLPTGVRVYTGDDFHYPELILGDGEHHSEALLGILAVIAPAAAAALRALDHGDRERYHAVLAPTVPLARQVFAEPTRWYKTGVAFLAWLAGHQDHFLMVGGLQAGRSPVHLAQALVLADAAGLLPDAALAAARARAYFQVCGVDQ